MNNLRNVPPRPSPRKGRVLSWAFLIALAFVAGDLAAAFLPGSALKFEGATSSLRAGIARILSPNAIAGIAAGAVFLVLIVLTVTAGKPAGRGYLIPALVLFLGAGAAGFHPVGHEVRVERDLAARESEAKSLQGELDQARTKLASVESRMDELQKQLDLAKKSATEAEARASAQLAAKDESMKKEASAVEEKLREKTRQAEEAQAERDKALAERKKSEDAAKALRAEIEELKKKLAEKKN